MNLLHYKYLDSNPEILGGKPCVINTRISVDLILEWLAGGADKADILKNYPQISPEALSECLLYAANHLRNEVIIDIKVA